MFESMGFESMGLSRYSMGLSRWVRVDGFTRLQSSEAEVVHPFLRGVPFNSANVVSVRGLLADVCSWH